MKERKCLWCPGLFYPHPRLKERQKSCGSYDCKRKQNLWNQKQWKKKNNLICFQGQRDWHKDRPSFWKNYRKEHPVYTERNRNQSKIRWRLSQNTLQKKLDILEVTEKTMEYWNLPRFAKDTRSLVPLMFAYTAAHEHESCSSNKSP